MPRQLELSIPKRIGFFLISGFNLNDLSVAITPLKIANRLSPTVLYQPVIYALSGEDVVSEEGPRIAPDGTTINPEHPPHLIMVCSPTHKCQNAEAIDWLKQQAQRNIPLGGITSGGLILARAGLLDGYRHVLPISKPSSHVNHRIVRYEADRDRMTCSSPMGALEMMINLISREHGSETAHKIRQRLVEEGLQPVFGERDPLIKERLSQHAARLLVAIAVMEANREMPLSPSVLADRSGLSLRHFERLFQEHCGCSPRQYYLDVRLDHARTLLQDTNMLIGDISKAIGLESASYFSRRYKERFGHSPNVERARTN